MEIQKLSMEAFCKERTFFFFFLPGECYMKNVFMLEKNNTNVINRIAALCILTLADLQVTSSSIKDLEVTFSWLMIPCFLETEICHTLSSLIGLAVWRQGFLPNMFLVTYHGGILWILCWPIIDHRGWSFLWILAPILLAGSKS